MIDLSGTSMEEVTGHPAETTRPERRRMRRRRMRPVQKEQSCTQRLDPTTLKNRYMLVGIGPTTPLDGSAMRLFITASDLPAASFAHAASLVTATTFTSHHPPAAPSR